MNKNIETTKIKVNNGQELINKAQEYKNSGGEWKLLESYWTIPEKGQTNQEKGWSRKNNSEGIKISNGEQVIDIYFEGLEGRINFNLTDECKRIKQIFSEISQTFFYSNNYYQFGKTENKGQEKMMIARSLNAWSVGDIFKIICDFVKDNQAEIKKSVAALGLENSLKHWIKVSNDNEGNIFIWLGKRDEEIINMNGGGELQISINRKDLEGHRIGPVYYKDLDNQQLVNELSESMGSFWSLISKDRNKGAMSAYENHQVGFTKTSDSNLDLPDKENYYTHVDDSLPGDNEPNKINDNLRKKPDWYYELENLKKIFQKHSIKKIKLVNGKLVITHNNNNNNNNEIITDKQLTNSSEYQLIKDSLQKSNKNELTSQEIGIKSDNNSTPIQPKNNNTIYWVCGISGALIIGVIIGYLLRKKPNKNIK